MNFEELPDEFKTVQPFDETNTKLFRVTAPLMEFKGEFRWTTVRFDGPVPVFAGERRIGVLAHTITVDEVLVGELVLDYNCPERLEIETGQIYADMKFKLNPPFQENNLTSITITGVSLSKEKRDLPSVGTFLL